MSPRSVLVPLPCPLSYIYTRQPTNPRLMPTNFYCLVRYNRVKNFEFLKELMLIEIFNSSIHKKWPILCLRIPVLQPKQIILIRSTPTYLSPSQPDQNMTNVRCIDDRHAVPHTNCGERGHPRPFCNRLENLSRSPRPVKAG